MLEVKNIVKSFGRNRVLNKISFKVNKGDIVSVIGPSGSGKSTLLRCINHLEEPNSGKIIFNGEEVTKKNITKVREKIGMVFQQFNLFANLTVTENIPNSIGNMKDVMEKLNGILFDGFNWAISNKMIDVLKEQ